MVVVDLAATGSVCLSPDNNGVSRIRTSGAEFRSCGGAGHRGGLGWGAAGVVALALMN